ncbi:MAG: leucine-rich repeat domain-containing protein [Bacilli bacterium]|nr:leucine-rich repeat domain-containing protein [Bacilli bacterium]
MKKLGLLVMPLMAISLLASCGGGNKPEPTEDVKFSADTSVTLDESKTIANITLDWTPIDRSIECRAFTFALRSQSISATVTPIEEVGFPPFNLTVTFASPLSKDDIGDLKFHYNDKIAKKEGEAKIENIGVKLPVVPTYTITWVNYNDDVLEVDENVQKGDMPHYDGKTPTRPNEGEHVYTFGGWSPEIVPASESTTYEAVYIPSYTTIDISIPEKADDYKFEFDYTAKATKTIKVDWGDGKTANAYASHTYDNPGDYKIIIDNIVNLKLLLGYDCNNYVTSIYLGNYITSISDKAFFNCYSLASIIIPNSVTSIGGSAFYNCSSLASIIIPNSVTSMGNFAFNGCSSLTSIIIPSSITSIASCAFSSCSSLNSVTIPNSVTSIGDDAFYPCNALTNVDLTNFTTQDEIPTCATSAFFNCPVTFEVASEEVANKFKNSSKGWPNSLDKYHWPGKQKILFKD